MLLLFTKRLLPLFITQFLGAFNDNIYKNALVILITYSIAEHTGENAQVLITIAAAVFILPFFIFSAPAGQLADKYDRAAIARWVKVAEIFIMLLAALAFYLENTWFMIAVLFILGVQSAFFGPVKYAILPQLLSKEELLAGNAYVEAGTFLAILFGTITGGLLILTPNGIMLVSVSLFLVALCGYWASIYIPNAPAPMPNLSLNPNILQETIKILSYSYNDKRIFYYILSISWFWLIGATFLAQFPTLVKNHLHTQAAVVTIFLTLFAVGISIGSFICAHLQRGAIKTTLVPIAALGMSLFMFDLYLGTKHEVYHNLHGLLSIESFLNMLPSKRIMLDMLLIAICGGIYIVPLYTLVQHESDPLYRARVIAALNVQNALFMVISAVFTLTMLAVGRTIPEVILTLGGMNLIVTVLIFRYL